MFTRFVVVQYSYDPSGRLYRSQHEVIHAWEELGLVVIDMQMTLKNVNIPLYHKHFNFMFI